MSLREEQCNKVCRILDNVLANRPTERDSLIVAVRKAFKALAEPSQVAKDIARIVENEQDMRVIAQPERIKGHWIESKGQNILLKNLIEKGETWRVCDKCGAGFMIGYQYECDKAYHETFHNFCPKCGADMREVTE